MSSHPCPHSDLPMGVLIASTAFVGVLCVISINAYFCCNTLLGHTEIRKMSTKAERRFVLLHYLVILPLFQGFVIWGPQLDPRVLNNSASVVVAWLAVNVVSSLLLALGFWSARFHVFSLQMVQVIQWPVFLFFLCDRALYGAMGIESLFVFLGMATITLQMYRRVQPATRIMSEEAYSLYQRNSEEIRMDDLRSQADLPLHDTMSFDCDSGIVSEDLQRIAAKNSRQNLVRFIRKVEALEIPGSSSSEKKKELEDLKRQASLYRTFIPSTTPMFTPRTTRRGRSSISGNTDSRGDRMTFESEEDF